MKVYQGYATRSFVVNGLALIKATALLRKALAALYFGRKEVMRRNAPSNRDTVQQSSEINV